MHIFKIFGNIKIQSNDIFDVHHYKDREHVCIVVIDNRTNIRVRNKYRVLSPSTIQIYDILFFISIHILNFFTQAYLFTFYIFYFFFILRKFSIIKLIFNIFCLIKFYSGRRSDGYISSCEWFSTHIHFYF